MISAKDWDLESDESEPVASPIEEPRDLSGNPPARLEVTVDPVEGQAIGRQVLVAALLPVTFFVGELLYRTGNLPEIIVGSIVLSILAGVGVYYRHFLLRWDIIASTPGLRPEDVPALAPLWIYILVPFLIAAPSIFVVAVFAVWSANHFIAVGISALVCGFAFVRVGWKPIHFFREYLLAQPEISPEERENWVQGPTFPDFRLLAILLLTLVTGPILLSTSHTILLVWLICLGSLYLKVTAVGHPAPVKLIVYLIGRSHVLLNVFSNQRDVTSEAERWHHWTPPLSKRHRWTTTLLLQCSLYLVLLTGLTYYCPWEFFAALCVPGFETNFLFVPEESPVGYEWLRLPFELSFKAAPLAGYMLTYVCALACFFIVPALVLFTVYFEQLVALEVINQKIKRVKRSYQEG